jgi:hypothetical protein
MQMLTTILIGTAIGVALTLEFIFVHFDVRTKKAAAEHSFTVHAVCMRVFALVAENAQLRVSLAAGEMTEEGKMIAKMTMAALGALTTTETDVILTRSPSRVTSQEPACSLEDKQ